jgi:hypothetical protein
MAFTRVGGMKTAVTVRGQLQEQARSAFADLAKYARPHPASPFGRFFNKAGVKSGDLDE